MYWDKWRLISLLQIVHFHFLLSLDYPVAIIHAWRHIATHTLNESLGMQKKEKDQNDYKKNTCVIYSLKVGMTC